MKRWLIPTILLIGCALACALVQAQGLSGDNYVKFTREPAPNSKQPEMRQFQNSSTLTWDFSTPNVLKGNVSGSALLPPGTVTGELLGWSGTAWVPAGDGSLSDGIGFVIVPGMDQTAPVAINNSLFIDTSSTGGFEHIWYGDSGGNARYLMTNQDGASALSTNDPNVANTIWSDADGHIYARNNANVKKQLDN